MLTMTHKIILLCGAIMMSGLAQAAPSTQYGQQKVVYHINYDDAQKQAATLKNIQNHINAVGEANLDVKIVMHGDGLAMLLKPDSLKNRPKIDALKLQGVAFNVCANTLKGKGVDFKNDLYDVNQSDIVSSGVAELAHLQGQGYLYLRP
jgi:hypothetical protein